MPAENIVYGPNNICSCSFWTGYCYDKNNKDYYWPDGSVVLNANLTEGDTSSEDCAIINRYGEWERSSCDIEHTAVCSLDVPYGEIIKRTLLN